jgi:Arc/MetJ-type ribon-helix-helix transcriptional regulator
MTITLKPEDQELIRKRLVDGAFQSAEEIIHRALETLDAQEAWVRGNRDAISEKIDRAHAEFERGEGIPGDEAKKRLQLMKETRRHRRS